MMNNEMERRSFEFEVRAEKKDDEYVLTGRPIVYNKKTDMGWFDEIIERGALDKTDLKDVRFLVNHDTSMIPLARSRRNNKNSTMKFSVDDEGMLIDWIKLDVENNADARALYSAVQRGDISGMSFMFSIRGYSWDDIDSEHPTRHITDIGTVVEVSVVTFPAYEQTEISARSKEALESARASLERERSLRAEAVDTELELLKAKLKIIGG